MPLTAGGHRIRATVRVRHPRARSRNVRTRRPRLTHALRWRTHRSHAARGKHTGLHTNRHSKGLKKTTAGHRHLSAATRAKLSAARKGKHLSASTRAKLSAARKGKHLSASTRAKLSSTRKGRHLSAATKAKLSAARRGHHLSASTKAKLSAANRGKHRHHTARHRAAVHRATHHRRATTHRRRRKPKK